MQWASVLRIVSRGIGEEQMQRTARIACGAVVPALRSEQIFPSPSRALRSCGTDLSCEVCLPCAKIMFLSL